MVLLNLVESSSEQHGHIRSQPKSGTFSIIRSMAGGLTPMIDATIDQKAQLKRKHFNEDVVIMPRKRHITRSFQQTGQFQQKVSRQLIRSIQTRMLLKW